MRSVKEAAKDTKRLKRDFIVREEQMRIDMCSMQTLLNPLWQKPCADLCALLFEERNPALLQKYNLEFVEA